MNNYLPVFFLGLVCYFLSASLTFGAIKFSGQDSTSLKMPVGPTPTQKSSKLKRNPTAPLTEECPLNGAMLTKEERNAWEKRRPLGIMIENTEITRPQSGLSFADVV